MKYSMPIMAAILTLMMLTGAVALAASSLTGTASMNAVIGNDTTVDIEISIQSSDLENVSGSANLVYDASPDLTSGTLNGDFQFTITGYEGVDFQASLSISGSFQPNQYTTNYQLSVSGDLSGLGTGYGGGFGQFPMPTTTYTYTGPGTGEPTSMPFQLTGSGSGQTIIENLYTYSTSTTTLDFYMQNGAYALLGVPGDISARILIDSESNQTLDGYVDSTASIVINFNSGDSTVDSQLAMLLYNSLMFAAQNETTAEYTLTISVSANTTAVFIEYYYTGYIGGYMGMPGMGEMPGMGPGMGMGTGMFLNPEEFYANYTVVPAFFEEAQGSYSMDLSISASTSTGTVTVEGSVDAQVSNLNPDALLVAPGDTQINVQVSGNTATVTVHAEGHGDAVVAFDYAKAIAVAIADLFADEPGVDTTISFQATGDITFVLVRGGERQELGSSFTFTGDQAHLIRYVYVEVPGTSIVESGEGTIVVQAQHKAVLTIGTVSQANMVVVNSKQMVVKMGTVVVVEPQVYQVSSGDAKAIVKILPGTKIEGSLEVEALSHQEANAQASNYGYTAAGDGVRIEGVSEGQVEVGVQLSQQAAGQGNIAILEISADGSTKFITDVEVTADGMVYFNASSFSTFIPVLVTGELPTQTTETQASPAPGTTTTGQTETGETGQTTTSQATSPVGGGETTGQAGETGTAEEGGIPTAAIVGVVVVIVIIAAAAMILRK